MRRGRDTGMRVIERDGNEIGARGASTANGHMRREQEEEGDLRRLLLGLGLGLGPDLLDQADDSDQRTGLLDLRVKRLAVNLHVCPEGSNR